MDSSGAVEFIFLGTGASGSVPHLSCLTPSENENEKPCRTCLSAIDGTPEGKRNFRRNTSAAARIVDKDGVKRTIVIDVGKDFRGSALEWFPKYGMRRIDAILLTHDHADAMNGLDDLRAWTQDGIIQTHIDVYLSEATFSVVKRAFPFLVSKEFATGGGDVAAFRWHIINYGVPFEILETGITITPLAVQHGWLQPRSSNKPYLCFGFNIQDTVIYISDGNHIPEETWALLEHSLPTCSESQIDSSPSTLATTTKRKPYPVLVLDCLHLIPYTAHFGIVEAVNVARRMGALRTYVTDIGHYVGHDEWVAIGEGLEREYGGEESGMTEVVRRGLNMVRDADREARSMLNGEERRREAEERGPVWLRPAHDGLRLVVSKEGVLEDGTYGA